MSERPASVADEAARARSKARHDLRTPINQIIGYAEMLAEQAQEDGRSADVADLQKICTAARHQLGLIEALFAEPEAGAPPAPTGAQSQAAAPAAAPADVPAAAPAGRADEDAEARAPSQGGEKADGRLLVVDDNELNRDMLARRLAARGFSVATAEDGHQALARIASEPFDLILLDVMMPGISGLEVLETLRRTRTASDLPVIMATAKDQSEDIVGALQLGANDYVTKPLDFPVVMARVQAQIALKRQKEQIQRLAEDLEKKNRFIRLTFGRYLSEEVVEALLESPEGLRLGGESRNVTILMSDLRGFTQVSERLGPEQVVHMLNTYLGAMADVIFAHQGTIDEFVGDAILAIFGAPISRDDDARRAVSCALAMQLSMLDVNRQLQAEGLPRLEMGIAVHAGEVVVGNIGSLKRAKYGIVGPAVNLTGRIESYTVGGQVLVSQAALAEAGADVEVGEKILVKAKGSHEPVTVFDLRGFGGEQPLLLPRREEALRVLARALGVRLTPLEGKQVGDLSIPGEIVRLSAASAELRAAEPMAALANLKIELLGEDGRPVPGDLYAKVLESDAVQPGCFLVRFTAVPPEIEAVLRRALPA